MKNWKTMILVAVYLIAMAALYVAFGFEMVDRDYLFGGIIIGSTLVMIVNRTWFLSDSQTE